MPPRKIRRDGNYSGYFDPAVPLLPWPEKLTGVDEIARFLRVSPATAKRLLVNGKIPAIKDDADRWMTTQRAILLWITNRHFDELETGRKGPERKRIRLQLGGKAFVTSRRRS